MIAKINILIVCLGIIVSCAGNKSVSRNEVPNFLVTENVYLPGIDTTVAKDAIQISNRIIVDFNRKSEAQLWYNKGLNSFQLADSLWAMYVAKNYQDSILTQIYNDWKIQHSVELRHMGLFAEFKSLKKN